MRRPPGVLKAILGVLDDPRLERAAKRVLGGLAVISMLVSLVAIKIALDTGQREREGRQIVRQALCGVASGIITAGRGTIEGAGRPYPEPYETNLRRLELVPPLADRALAARLGAEAYSRGIAEEAQKTSGRRDLVNADGTLNCANLNRAASP